VSGGAAAGAPDWLEALARGERAAIARAITAVENDTPEAAAVLGGIYPRLGRALVVGFTGAPGAGKSTLVSAYVGELRRRGLGVGVVAVDPSSPVSGGAILGDRIRMTQHAGDPGVFVRSLAARGHLGGLSRTATHVIDVLDAAGKDVVVVETVGAGQSEVEIADAADVKVVVLAPGLGDEVQAIKAGIIEIADILVVNKADLPQAERTARQLAAGAGRAGAAAPPVVRTVATSGVGVAELADTIAARGRRQRPRPEARLRRLLAVAAAERLRHAIEILDRAEADAICAAALKGEIGFDEAARRLAAVAAEERKP
jgi:LAO/AO transport system kinase